MWKFIAICLIVLVFLFAVSHAQIPITNPVKPKVGMSLTLGSKDGFGSEIACHFKDLAGGFHFNLRVGIGYAYVKPGDPIAARRIFINDATNGVPEKNGRKWDYKLDVIYPQKVSFWGILPYTVARDILDLRLILSMLAEMRILMFVQISGDLAEDWKAVLLLVPNLICW